MKDIAISREKPAIYDKLHDKFGADWNNGVIIAFGGKIHSKDDIMPQKVVHEKIHLDRQKEMGDDVWWTLYIDNEIFRLEEESIAYRAEAKFIKNYINNREVRFQMLREIAHAFSSSLYGNIVTIDEAMRIIG